MSVKRGRAELRDAIHSTAREKAADAEGVVQTMRVVDASPLTLQKLEGRGTLHDDQFDLSENMAAYERDTGFEEGDTLMVVRKRRGGGIMWVVFDVLSGPDKLREKNRGSAARVVTAFPANPYLGQIVLRRDMTPRKAYMYTGDGALSGWSVLNA